MTGPPRVLTESVGLGRSPLLAAVAGRLSGRHRPILAMGIGMALCVSIPAAAVLADVPVRSAGPGSGVTNAILQLGAPRPGVTARTGTGPGHRGRVRVSHPAG